MATENTTASTPASTPENTSARAKEWLEKVDQSSIGDLRRKYPKAFWIVGGVVILSLLL